MPHFNIRKIFDAEAEIQHSIAQVQLFLAKEQPGIVATGCFERRTADGMTGADKAGGQKPLVRMAARIIPRQVVILSSEVIFDAKADGSKVGMRVEIGYRPSEHSLIAKDCIAVEC